MKLLTGIFVIMLLADLLVLHSEVIKLKGVVSIQESVLNARLKKATANQDKLIKRQEAEILKHTVGIQDRVSRIENEYNECKIQVVYLTTRLDQLETPVKKETR